MTSLVSEEMTMLHPFWEDIRLVGRPIDHGHCLYLAHIRLISLLINSGSGGSGGGRYLVFATCFIPRRILQNYVHLV